MTLFFLVQYGLYAVLVTLLIVGWHRALRQRSATPGTAGISIIIAARNEAPTIALTIDSIVKLKYPADRFELIVVDDHSTDQTNEIVGAVARSFPNFSLINSNGQGKKAALGTGIAHARYDIIATTDADCTVPPEWLQHINALMSDEHIKLLIGPVKVEGVGFFGSLQAVEFCSLTGTAGATLGFGVPSLSNGANLVYRKNCFTDVGGYTGNSGISSGDDEFLVRKFYTKWKGGVQWLNNADAVVTTRAHRSPKDFFNQRFRWAGKWRPDFSILSTWVAILVWLIHAGFVGFMISSISGKHDAALVVALMGSKLVMETLFLYRVSTFLRGRWSWFSFLVLQFIYSFYVVFVGFLSLFVVVKWKGRVVNTKAGPADRRV